MNDIELAKIIKQMPADMVAESAEFDKTRPVTTGNTRKRGSFKFRPALATAVLVFVVAILSTVIVGIAPCSSWILSRRTASSVAPFRLE